MGLQVPSMTVDSSDSILFCLGCARRPEQKSSLNTPLFRGERGKGNSCIQDCHCQKGKDALDQVAQHCAVHRAFEQKQVRREEERRASELTALLAVFSLTPRTGPGRHPSLWSAKGARTLDLGRGQGAKPRKGQPPAAGI